MATTVTSETEHSAGGLHFKHLVLTAAGGDTTMTYTQPNLLGATKPIKTTGTQSAMNYTYVASTGVLTIVCANSDVARITLIY